MTKQDWKALEEKLSGTYGSQNLEIDGYRIGIEKMMSGATKLVYAIYVNGCMKGEWIVGNTDEAKELQHRFFCRKETRNWKLKMKTNLLKCYPKKEHKEVIERLGLDKTTTTYRPWFKSFTTLKSTFIKNNKSIKLINEQ
jgi:hypothetical protein